MAGRTNQAVRVRGSGKHQRVARPCPQMLVQGSDRRVGPARGHQVEESDVAGLARRQTNGHVLGRSQGRPRRRHVAFPHQYLRLAGMYHGKSRVGCDGAIERLDRARVEGQRQIAALNVGVPRGGGDSGQGQVVSVR